MAFGTASDSSEARVGFGTVIGLPDCELRPGLGRAAGPTTWPGAQRRGLGRGHSEGDLAGGAQRRAGGHEGLDGALSRSLVPRGMCPDGCLSRHRTTVSGRAGSGGFVSLARVMGQFVGCWLFPWSWDFRSAADGWLCLAFLRSRGVVDARNAGAFLPGPVALRLPMTRPQQFGVPILGVRLKLGRAAGLLWISPGATSRMSVAGDSLRT